MEGLHAVGGRYAEIICEFLENRPGRVGGGGGAGPYLSYEHKLTYTDSYIVTPYDILNIKNALGMSV
jgi:hypothetical protein